MKLFCCYAFTGEDAVVVTQRMRMVVDTLAASGHEAYCNRFDPAIEVMQQQDDIPGILKSSLQTLSEQDAVVVVLSSANRSIGQIMEIGVAYHLNKPIYLFEHESASGTHYLEKIAASCIKWNTDEDLKYHLSKLAV